MQRSITDTSIHWPAPDELLRALTLQEYNTRVVVCGTMLLGLASGIVGTFMLLRKRALLGDALSHATLPGIGAAFMTMVALGGSGKWLPGLLLGALLSGILGMACVLGIRNGSRLKEDAALGIVLSVFFGFGATLLSIIQQMSTGSAAGLETFIYGKTASMIASDAMRIAAVGAAVIAVCSVLYKEFALLCFDSEFAASQGWPTLILDALMMALVVSVTVIGLQAVGLILMIALLVIPPAAARFWSHHLMTTVIAAAAIGAASGFIGGCFSALVPRLPAGAVIVMVAGLIFGVSMVFGPARGVLWRYAEHFRLTRRITRQHLLRAIYEAGEVTAALSERPRVGVAQLLAQRSWSPSQLGRAIAAAEREGLLTSSDGDVALTARGRSESERVVRNHRLWELYLITHADIAPSHVDRDADRLEHVLAPAVVRELEALLDARGSTGAMPLSPHKL